MSHVTHIEIVISDLDALREAAEACDCELIEGQKTYKWFGKWVNDYHSKDAAYHHGIDPKQYGKCEHAIRIKGGKSNAYEVGVCKNPNGEGYVLIYDFYAGGNGLEAKIGHRAEKLEQQYKASAVKSEMARKGFKVTKSWEQDGNIQMEFEKARKSY